MKILITDYGNYIPYGSSYNESIELFKYLKERGEDVDLLKRIIISPIEGSINENDAFIRKYNFIISYTPFDFDFIIRYNKLSGIHPDIIFIDEFDFIKVIGNKLHFLDPKRFLYKNFLKIMDDIQFYTVRSIIDEDFVHKVITNIKTIYINPYAKNSYFVKPSKIEREKIIFSGRLNESLNDIDLLLKAVKYITEETDFLKTHNLLVVMSNGDESEKIKNKISKMNIDENFIFISPSKNYPEILSSAGFSVVLPLRNLRIGNILELMATGLPILIADNVNDVKLLSSNGVSKDHLVEDGKNGLVYDHEDYKDLAEKIMLMISLNNDTYSDMRSFSSNYASNFNSKYEYQKIYNSIKDLYLEKIKNIENKEFSKI